jgi:hypothetical protein
MEELHIRVQETQERLQNLLESMSSQGQDTSCASLQQAGKESNQDSILASPVQTPEQQTNSQSESVIPVGSSLFMPHLFQQLPQPFSQSLKELPIIDGRDVNSLLDFLLRLIRMNQVSQIMTPGYYKILYPYCRGEVLQILSQVKTTGVSFDVLLEQLLSRFILTRQLSQLRVERYERVQGMHESLAQYVQDIREAALLLRIAETETQMVQRIVDGFNPSQLTRSVFQSLLPNINDLEQLIVLDRNRRFADQMREQGVVNRRGASEGVVPETSKADFYMC